MKKIIFLGIVLLMVLGCGDKKAGVDIPTITTKDLYQGTDGLALEFIPNSPPDQVYERGYAPVGLNLKNKGTFDIVDGYLSISLEKDYMNAQENSYKSMADLIQYMGDDHLLFDIKGKSIESGDGENDQVTFITNINELEEMSIVHSTAILATACYKYQTQLSDQICIDTDVFGTRTVQKPCKTESKTFSSQGAPVAITQVEMSMLPDVDNDLVRPQIIIQINNLGNGEVIEDQRTSISKACSAQAVEYKSWNKVIVNAVMGSNRIFDCDLAEGTGNSAEVVLKEKTAKVRCIYQEGIPFDEGTHSEPLFIQLDYGYTTSISKTIKINKLKG
ncbi:MAG: hypothetical protein KJ601_04330 [Nanoarchaeota archaeon]|nr:hypothetical protein [Nanoarchaeota archaeon]MBU1704247.1 hypothetical protein [Nanoarchaeota archaeon]